jgi:hypothetical protein
MAGVETADTAAAGVGHAGGTVDIGVGGALERGVPPRGGTLYTIPLTRGVPGGRIDGVPGTGVDGTAKPEGAGEAPAPGVDGTIVFASFRSSF